MVCPQRGYFLCVLMIDTLCFYWVVAPFIHLQKQHFLYGHQWSVLSSWLSVVSTAFIRGPQWSVLSQWVSMVGGFFMYTNGRHLLHVH